MRILRLSEHRRLRQSGTSIYATTIMLVMIIPMIGLAIDGSLLYVVKSQLQGAVDGAALAASRALARGQDGPAQKTSARAAAATYVNLNFASGYFLTTPSSSSSNPVIIPATDVTIDDTSVPNQRTVSVLAHAIEPALFMRWLNFSTTTVNANASTVRRDVNIVLVLDRSGSMTASGSCAPMKQAAINYMTNFAPLRDNVSLISFSTTTQVQIPITNSFRVNGIGVAGAVDFTTAINGITCAGSTGSAAGLWKAYDQLVGLNQTTALNFITFFTDGEPTGIDANMPIAAASLCSAAPSMVNGVPARAGLPANYSGKYLTGMYATYVDGSAFIGLANNAVTPNSDGTPNIINGDQGNSAAPQSTNCAFANPPWYTNWNTLTDFRGIPTTDIYGNSTSTSYQSVTTVTPAAGQTYVDITNHNNGIPLATNAADDAARRIRIAANDPVYGRGLAGIIIHAIGLGNAPVALPADGLFLMRVTNTTNIPGPNPIYDGVTYPTGLYKYVPNSQDIGNAFQEIASEILRLSR